MYEFTIGKVAERTGLAASAIRYYESIGLVPKPFRINGRRVYDEKWMKRLGVVLLVKEAGFTIKEIHDLTETFRISERPTVVLQAAADKKVIELNDQIARIEKTKKLLEMISSCGCSTVEDCGAATLKQLYVANH